MKNLENILGELEFLNSEILTKLEKLELQNLKKVNEKLEKISSKDIDKEYIESLQKEMSEVRQKFLKEFKTDINLMEAAKKEIDENKKFLLNVLNEIKKENKKAIRNTYVLNKINIFTVIIIFILSAIMGYYFGCNHFSF
jgi:Fe2+ transport system protein B